MTIEQKLAENLTTDQALRLRCVELSSPHDIPASLIYHYVMTGETSLPPMTENADGQASS